jgi:cell division protein FtsQ
MAIKKQAIIKWMLTTLWIAIGAGAVVLLVAAVRKKDSEHCRGININIKGVNNIFFVDNKDILDSIAAIEGDNPVGKPIGSFNLKIMETKLAKNVWVKRAELFFDNNETLQVNVIEREPVARIFTTSGTTFYIDSAIKMLPLSEKFSARLPVFTDFPSDKIILSNADSSLLKDIKTMSIALQADSFCMALIDQVDITPQRTFEMIPKVGNNIIVFGDATDIQEKFNKLKLFYKNIMVKAGWSYYSVINVQYKNEVVAKRKGADDKTADSLRTIQIMQQIAANAEKEADDSLQMIQSDNGNDATDSSIIQQSIQRDENEDAPNAIEKITHQENKTILPFVPKPAPVVVKHITPSEKPADKKPGPVPVKKIVVAKPVTTYPKHVDQKYRAAPVQATKPVTPKPVVKKKVEQSTNNDY